MKAYVCRDGRCAIANERPRSGLVAQGVGSRTVSFRDVIRGDWRSRTATVFKAGRAPAPCRVRGLMGNIAIVPEGSAPVRRNGCAIAGVRPDRLVFAGQ